MAFKVSWIYEILDRYSRPAKRIAASTDAIKQKLKNTSNSLRDASSKMANFRTMMATTAGVAALAMPLKAAADFEEKMIAIQRVIDFKSTKQFKSFKDDLMELALYLGQSPIDIAAIAAQSGRMKLPVKDILKFTELIGRTSVAFDMSAEEASNYVRKIKTVMNMNIPQVTSLMDKINYLGDRTNAVNKDMLQITARVSGQMKLIKMPPDLMAGWVAFANQIDISPQKAASGLRMMIRELKETSRYGRKLVKDPNGFLKGFLEKISKMKPARRNRLIKKVFGDEAGRFVELAITNLGLLDDALALSTGVKARGSMIRELEKKLAGTNTAMDRMKTSLTIVEKTIGERMLPRIKALSPEIVKFGRAIKTWVEHNPELVDLGLAVTGVLTAFTASAVVIGTVVAAGAFLFTPFVLGAAAVLTLSAALVVLYNKNKKFKGFVHDLKGGLEGMKNLLPESMGGEKTKWPRLSDYPNLRKYQDTLKSVETPLASQLSYFIDSIKDIGLTGVLKKGLTPNLSGAYDAIRSEHKVLVEVKASPGSEVVGVKKTKTRIVNTGRNMAEAQ